MLVDIGKSERRPASASSPWSTCRQTRSSTLGQPYDVSSAHAISQMRSNTSECYSFGGIVVEMTLRSETAESQSFHVLCVGLCIMP